MLTKKQLVATRARMEKWFGKRETSDEGPIEFLLSHGFVLTTSGHWRLPTPSHAVSCYEMECVVFLAEEWEFGGLVCDLKTLTVRCLCGEKQITVVDL